MAFVLGQTLYRQAIHGGKAKNDRARHKTVPCSYAGACSPRRMCSLRRCAPRATSSGAGCI
jgi:hypothetical protein